MTYIPNKKFAESDPYFRKVCEKAGIAATQRQAAKFRRQEGRAYKNKGLVDHENKNEPK